MDQSELIRAYESVKKSCHLCWISDATSAAIIDIATQSLKFLLDDCKAIHLQSLIPKKDYFSFSRDDIVSRPANSRLFLSDPSAMYEYWRLWMEGTLDKTTLSQLLYTVALAPCLAMELFNRNNKKGPATYFECFIGHIFAKTLGISPIRSTTLAVAGMQVRMTMDFLFKTSKNCPNIHLPVKMSTRERVVQAWAHQRLLDASYGCGSYLGLMVLFSETKLDSRSHEVVEICVPDQWVTYQALLAKMDGIYYFDLPTRYRQLTKEFPSLIHIRPFHHFFNEIASLVGR